MDVFRILGLIAALSPKFFFGPLGTFFPPKFSKTWNVEFDEISGQVLRLLSYGQKTRPLRHGKKMCFFACALGLASKLFTKGNEYNFASFLLMVKCSKAQPNAVREAGPNFGLFRI